MKQCKQVKNFGTNFHGWVLPRYALFGTVNEKLYVCANFKFGRTKDGTVVPYYRIRIWNGYRWEDSTTREHPDIRRAMSKFMHSDEFVKHAPVKCERRMKAMRDELMYGAPHEKRHPIPQYGHKSGCYSQSRVDGRGYDISWEESYTELTNYSGMPVEYISQSFLSKPKAAFTPFDGLLDDVKKDGMKVKQIKCRPGKPYVVPN